jgi:hypothetical protein
MGDVTLKTDRVYQKRSLLIRSRVSMASPKTIEAGARKAPARERASNPSPFLRPAKTERQNAPAARPAKKRSRAMGKPHVSAISFLRRAKPLPEPR